MTIKTI